MKIRYLLITAVLATAILCSAGYAGATTTTDTAALIAQLQAQIASLMAQIQALQTQQGTTTWCHTFNTNLGYANSGTAEAGYLHTALNKQGISYSPDNGNTYSEGTMSAVVQFQAKYGILQTGYVGPLTRAKLNALYGCGITTQPSITSIFPTFASAGTSVTIYGSNIGNTIGVEFSSNVFNPATAHDFPVVSKNDTRVTFIVPSTFNIGESSSPLPAGVYNVSVVNSSIGSNSLPFTVTSSNTQPSITVTLPKRGDTWEIGREYAINWDRSAFLNTTDYDFTPISLKNNDNGVICTMGKNSGNSGAAYFTVPVGNAGPGLSCNGSITPGNNYQIIVSSKNNSISSDIFSITPYSVKSTDVILKLISPNGGEQWAPGTTHNITWNAQNISQVFDISVQTSGVSNFGSEVSQSYSILMSSSFAQNNPTHIDAHTVIQNLDSTARSFSWTVPTDFKSGQYNRIGITGTPVGCENGGCGGPVGANSNSFSIASSAQPLSCITSIDCSGLDCGASFGQGCIYNCINNKCFGSPPPLATAPQCITSIDCSGLDCGASFGQGCIYDCINNKCIILHQLDSSSRVVRGAG